MKKTFCALLAGLSLFALAACGGFRNPDFLGGGGVADHTPSESQSELEKDAKDTVNKAEIPAQIPQNATRITKDIKITAAGDYLVEGAVSGKINVKAEGVRLFLNNATIISEKKVIESDYALTLVLFGTNRVENSNADGSNAIDAAGDLLIGGTGSLSVKSTKNGIKGNSLTVKGATLQLETASDGLHAEIDKYDDLETAPAFSYADGGYVYLDGAKVTVRSGDDGIQADTFVYITGESALDITTNGGAPQKITEQSSDSGDGKGIKAGAIDWGADDKEITEGGYLIAVESGTIKVNANDDAIHSDGEIAIRGGTLEIAAGDDAVHADKLLTVSGGSISIDRCYEGIEAAKVEISGGKIDLVSVDDGINAADGTSARPGQVNNNCHIIISGGDVYVNAEGDGLDSNGSMLISGGNVYVTGPSRSGNAALDADGSIIVNGGNLVAVGPLGMVETPASNSEQNVVSFGRSSAISAGTNLYLADSKGNVLLEYTTLKSCQSVIFSCAGLKKGESYKIYGGDSELCSFTVNSVITTVGSTGGIGNPGGGPGGWGGRR